MIECQVCFEEFEACITCINFKCNLTACIVCQKTYIVGSNRLAGCMSCKMAWSIDFLYKNFGEWIDELHEDDGVMGYREYMKNILLESERSKITETLADNFEVRRDLYFWDSRSKKLHQKYNTVAEQIKKDYNVDGDLVRYQQRVDRAKNAWVRHRNRLDNEKRNLNERLQGISHGNSAPKVGYTFICACPVDECRGKVGMDMKCILCMAEICDKCRVVLGKDTHECNENDVKTFAQLKLDTKPCPKCASGIYKIQGCSQMWCTACHTPFDWNTGEIITNGNFHNPHAIQWYQMRGGGGQNQNQDAEGCEIPQYWLFFTDRKNDPTGSLLECIFREVAEIYDRRLVTADEHLAAIRLQYVLGAITEKGWRQKIFMIDRQFQRRRVTHEILQTYVAIMHGELRKIAAYVNKHSKDELVNIYDKIIKRWGEIGKYINECLARELKFYGINKHNKGNTRYLRQVEQLSK